MITKSHLFSTEVWIYARQIKQFNRKDWIVYLAWVGLMLGLLTLVSGFIFLGRYHGVPFPKYVWNVPIGIAIFVGAIAFDTIGHRTAYAEELEKGEKLVHHVTIAAGVSSVIFLCLGYHQPEFFKFPALTMIILSIFYSVIDEGMHWRRYLSGNSDRVEMWSHFFIFTGHILMILSWYHWFNQGYPGVEETLLYF